MLLPITNKSTAKAGFQRVGFFKCEL